MRTELDELTWNIMNAMADDWESLEQIAPSVERDIGVSDRLRIAELLIQLHSEELLKEMYETPNHQIEPEMILNDAIRYWFKMTDVGRDLWDSDAYKYCDEDGDYIYKVDRTS